MSKLVVLKVNEGDWERGFSVILQIGEEGKLPSVQVTGKLPGNRELPQFYQEWQSLYRSLPNISRLVAPTTQVTNVAIPEDCYHKVQDLRNNLNRWVDSETFRPLKERLLESLDPSESIRVIIQTADSQMRQLPWHLLDFFERFQKAEVSISGLFYEKVSEKTAPSLNKIRILAILGNSEGIDVDADRKFLENLPWAETVFLIEPPRRDISDRLWEQPWDIFFFAGHSCSHGQTGLININSKESLSLGELKHGLRKAIEKGLQLAIFNSCDGLGLAQELTSLSIPQVIVMREPVPDKVAQDFLKYFLNAFSEGQSLYLSVRTARERLYEDGLEAEIPGVTWLPVIFQNPATLPFIWSVKKRAKFSFPLVERLVAGGIFVIALVTILFLMGIFSDFKLYQDSELGIKVKYPKNWEVIKLANPSGEIAKFVSPLEDNLDPFQESVRFTIESVEPTSTSLDQYSQETIRRISQELTADTLHPNGKKTQLANQEAREVIYTLNKPKTNAQKKILQVWTIDQGKAYILTYETEENQYDKYEKIAREMIESFKIK
jgi:hypothetical protein